MSPRHLGRAFAAETGMTPAKAIERLRLEASRERIERFGADRACGRVHRLRRPRTHAPRFHSRVRQPPQALRRAAKAESASTRI
jgi:transcriptional regulator GlxA family with amidase domain